MKIKFCGAAQTVTGSAHLIELSNGLKILLDCGLYQGQESDMVSFNRQWLFEPSEIDMVVLSHAHIDHSGRLPRLVKDGFQGKIFSTHATRSLCSIMLLDSAKIQERDAEYDNERILKKNPDAGPGELQQPLYDVHDVKQTMDLFATFGYDRWFSIHPDVDVLFSDAGHILGSASVVLRINDEGRTVNVGFTGDIGRPNRPILRDPKPMPPVDFLIAESTYGDRLHDSKPYEEERFLHIIKETCIENKGKLIIPAFSVGRTQEIVYMLDQLETAGALPHIDVYVDSPLAVNATMIFGAHPECYDDELNEYLLVDENPFGFNALTYVREVALSKALNTMQEPCIIISSSGMMNAGRIRHHMYNNIDQKRNTFLIVGYCAPHTPGGMLRAGKRKLRIFGETKEVRSRIEVMDSFSAHADRDEMTDFLDNQKKELQRLFLVHGEKEPQESFKAHLMQKGFANVEIPELGQEFRI